MTDKSLTTTSDQDWALLEKVVIEGDLSKLSDKDRVNYYRLYCESLGLNPTTRPFDYIRVNGKLVLYAKKDATEQLRKQHNVSIPKTINERIDDLYVVTATAHLPNGRSDTDIGAVNVSGLKGEALANAMMKAITKAKRRVTLSICGLGVLDESEIHTIPHAQFVEEPRETPQVAAQATPARNVDMETGEITETPEQPKPKRMPDDAILRLEELATKANVSFDQMDTDAQERYGKSGYIWLNKANITDYVEWLKALAAEREGLTEQGELIEA